jgi:hypothetical protein
VVVVIAHSHSHNPIDTLLPSSPQLDRNSGSNHIPNSHPSEGVKVEDLEEEEIPPSWNSGWSSGSGSSDASKVVVEDDEDEVVDKKVENVKTNWNWYGYDDDYQTKGIGWKIVQRSSRVLEFPIDTFAARLWEGRTRWFAIEFGAC